MKPILLISAAMLATLMSLALYIFSLDGDIRRCDESLNTLTALKLADLDVDSDVLKTRTGLVDDYRGLIAAGGRSREALAALAQYAQTDPELSRLVSSLTADHRGKETLLRDFQKRNSLLAQSMGYFSKESAERILAAGDMETARTLGALAAAVHRLCFDSSPAAVNELRARFTAAASTKAISGNGANTQAAGAEATAPLLAHARALATLLPDVHELIAQLQPLPQKASFASTQRYLESRQDSLMRRSQYARSGLLLLSIAMLATLLFLAKMLHDRARALRRRSDFDRMMMAISRDLVSLDRGKTDQVIVSNLRSLSRWAGDAYVGLALLPSNGDMRLWPDSSDIEFKAVIAIVDAYAPAHGDRSHALLAVTKDARVIELAQDKPAMPRQVQWICLRRRSESGSATLLCFECSRANRLHEHFRDLPLLNSALDTLAEALERQRLEDEAQALEKRLARARRMETVGTMASGISHNFNNIIGAIRGNVEAAQIRLAPRIPAQSHLSEISRALDHASDLVEGILGFGRAQNYNMQPVELNTLLAQTVSLLAASLPKTVELDVRQHAPSVHAWGNPAQLQQVILNLATNAAQAMSMRGMVSIRLSAATGTREDASAPATARLEVSDHGIGIPEQRLSRIFDPFFTTRDGGTGLGLATVKQIIGNHDGRIDVVSEPGLGSTFSIELPLCNRIGDSVAAPCHETWLVVCDDAAALERLEDLLAALGHEPVGFAETASAESAMAAQPERFDGVLIQIEDKRESTASAHALHRIESTRPTIVATRVDALGAPGSRLECTIAEIIPTPVDPSELMQAMERSRNGHRARTAHAVA